ncbi:RNase HII [Desulfonatronum thiosulfatophilum]|uniref:Ribonuclease HII n=1 Tax=Desulfonatronum thiosulfatophilum TaxID=617002 RepID=A0A1G6AL97_9BACT|nr:ribonuclease HII [Desulfonatronum thiosulfatophilum]SDB09176.1 RNase HII [Desulfonatronum thiosulfatophilum]
MVGGENLRRIGQVAGLDEAGRGCLAGPVVAAAVILPESYSLPGLTDSKKVRSELRVLLAKAIREQAVAWSVGVAWPREIETLNILRASLRAMCRAVLALKIRPDALIVDGPHKIPLDTPQQAIIKADETIPAVSAASILAKPFRDKLLTSLDRRYPGYDLARHKGYATALHLEALRRLGPSPTHRLTFKGVRVEETHCSRQERQWLPGI